MEFTGKVVEGKITQEDPRRYEAELKRLEGFMVDVRIIKHKDKVSNLQHRYYRGGVIRPACEQLNKYGYKIKTKKLIRGKEETIIQDISPDYMHWYYMKKFYGELVEMNNHLAWKIPSSSDFKTDEMVFFTELVRMDLDSPDNEWLIQIPTMTPDEYWAAEKEKWNR